MIEELLKGSDYKIIKIDEKDEKIEIFPRSELYPEDCIAIEKETLAGLFTVYEVHRDEKQIKATTTKENEAYLYAAISYNTKDSLRLILTEPKHRKSAVSLA